MYRKAIIFGIKGTKLTRQEKSFIKKEKPWGIILFSRNIRDLYQLRFLIDDIKKSIKDKNFPILIDEEGGKVSRFNKIFNLSAFSQSFFTKIYKKDKNFHNFYKFYIDTICNIFNFVGININTVPVLDVMRLKSHSIIGSRSFSSDADLVSKIGKICIDLHKVNKIFTIVKHIPGHGLSRDDSHKKLPIVSASKSELIKKDFKPFKDSNSLFAMTAHVVFSKYDPFFCATHSKKIIKDVIRKHIGFKGILISDDISMKALKLGIKKNATMALEAGCNLVLHCNGRINEMKELARVIPRIDAFTQKKTSDFYKFLR